MNPPWVRVTIVNYNAGSMLERCVQALASQTMADFEAIIVDNASTCPPIHDLALPDARFRIVPSPVNLGFAAGTNLAARNCRAPWIATLNPDAFPRPDWLARLRAATKRYPWAEAFGSTQLSAGNPEIVDGFGDNYAVWGSAWRSFGGRPVSELPAVDGEIFSPCAAAALYAARVFAEEEGMDEAFFCYLDDVDLGFRLRLRGGRCVQIRDAVVLHVGSAVSGYASDFTIWHSYRNRLWMLIKDVPFPLILLVLPLQLPFTVLSACRQSPRHTRVAALRGILAAIRGLAEALAKRGAVQRRRTIGNLQCARLLVWRPSGYRRPSGKSLSAAPARPAGDRHP